MNVYIYTYICTNMNNHLPIVNGKLSPSFRATKITQLMLGPAPEAPVDLDPCDEDCAAICTAAFSTLHSCGLAAQFGAA